MMLKLENFTESHARQICNWKYDGEYSIYNYPSWNEVSNDKWAITVDKTRRSEFSALLDEYNNLCGYIRIQDQIEYVLIGVGLNPSLCGQGLGNTLMELAKQQCTKLYPSKTITLEVRSFNDRAIKCYKKAGFIVKELYKRDSPIGYGEFIRMEFNY